MQFARLQYKDVLSKHKIVFLKKKTSLFRNVCDKNYGWKQAEREISEDLLCSPAGTHEPPGRVGSPVYPRSHLYTHMIYHSLTLQPRFNGLQKRKVIMLLH